MGGLKFMLKMICLNLTESVSLSSAAEVISCNLISYDTDFSVIIFSL